MLKLFFYFIVAIVLITGVYFTSLSINSRKQPELGLLNGQLRPCPDSPNCVCSEHQHKLAMVEPIDYSLTATEAMQQIRQVIVAQGGEIISGQDNYLHAIFVTPLFRFIDDVEVRIDPHRQLVHIRSASRAGHSDLGVNRQRVAKLRRAFEAVGG